MRSCGCSHLTLANNSSIALNHCIPLGGTSLTPLSAPVFVSGEAGHTPRLRQLRLHQLRAWELSIRPSPWELLLFLNPGI